MTHDFDPTTKECRQCHWAKELVDKIGSAAVECRGFGAILPWPPHMIHEDAVDSRGTDLAFATNEELIRELLSRTTFCGVLIFRKEPYKGDLESRAARWEARNCDAVTVLRETLEKIEAEGAK